MDTCAGGETAKTAGGTGSSMVVGEDYKKMVQNIVDMGYEKAQVYIFKINSAASFVPPPS